MTHADKVILADLLVCHGVVCISVKHDDGKGKQVGAISCLEDVRVVAAVTLCKLLHDPVYLLCLTCRCIYWAIA